MKAYHCFEPVFDNNSKILILGTMPSPKSRENGFYYSHPRNRMWSVLASVFETPTPSTSEEKKLFLIKNNIAMWDVLSSCEIENAADSSIKAPVANDLSVILNHSPIKAIFTTGTKAFSLYNKYCKDKTKMPAVLLPSTSPANCAVSLDTLKEKYKNAIRKALDDQTDIKS